MKTTTKDGIQIDINSTNDRRVKASDTASVLCRSVNAAEELRGELAAWGVKTELKGAMLQL